MGEKTVRTVSVNFRGLARYARGIDWVLFIAVVLLSAAGLATMNSFLPAQAGVEGNIFFEKQRRSLKTLRHRQSSSFQLI